MAGCSGCGGSCGKCRSLELTRAEMDFLRKLGEIPFLPVARKADSEKPVYLEEGEALQEHYALVLMHLERKGLISLDYDISMTGGYSQAYDSFPLRGSMALTNRGQQVLDTMEYSGVGGWRLAVSGKRNERRLPFRKRGAVAEGD